MKSTPHAAANNNVMVAPAGAQTTPKSLRLAIAILGRTNVGKSTLLNAIAGQDVAITAPEPGTTTDVVEKPMELLPLGPVLFLDTAGYGDTSSLGARRLARTARAMERAEIGLLVLEAGVFGAEEEAIVAKAQERKLPLVAVVNTRHGAAPDPAWLASVRANVPRVVCVSALAPEDREAFLNALKQELIALCPDDYMQPPPLLGDLVPPGGVVMLVVPIDSQAPKGRLILPQVQAIRDALDNSAAALVLTERELARQFELLRAPPNLVVCDSQVVDQMTAATPRDVPCTTFSILMARLKGDLERLAEGAAAVALLRDGDNVLIAEACSHHPLKDDIGRIKIPRWLRQCTGAELKLEYAVGRDFPADLRKYRLIVQCGACMLTRREMLNRIQLAAAAGVPITNYGLCIARTQGVLERVLTPFPAALAAYARAAQKR